MNLIRCTKQGRQSFEDYFREYYSRSDPSGLLYGKMKSLLFELRKLPFEKRAYCLTSHTCLRFVSRDDPVSTSWASVRAEPLGFHVEYRVPDTDAPWPSAHMSGEFESPQVAAEAILLGLKRSGGWAS